MSQSGNFSLSAKDVIHIDSFQGQASLFREDSTLKLQKILRQIEEIFQQSGALSADEVAALLQHGIPCEILQPGAPDWQTGVLQLKLEFQPSSAPMAASVNLQQAAQATSPAIVDRSPQPEDLGSEDLGDHLSDDLGIDLSDNPGDDLDEDFGIEEQLVAEVPSLEEDAFSADLLVGEPEAAFAPSDESLGDDLEGLLAEDTGSESTDAAMTDLSGELSDELSEEIELSFMSTAEGLEEAGLDLDSQSVESDSLGDLDSPWNLDSELDAMLLQNGNG